MRVWRLFALVLAVVLAVSACDWTAGEPELSPQEVVTKFYRWYIGYPGNPLVDREYRESPYLAESFIKDVDEILKGGFHADPILLAQDIPERFSVDEAETSGDQATVMVDFYWGGNPTPAKRRIDLQLTDSEWQITDVSMIAP
jgi:hypothetical protein